jgi:hypothetical protein
VKLLTVSLIRLGLASKVTDYRLDDRSSIPDSDNRLSLYRHIQTGSRVHTASYPMRERGSFAGIKRPVREADH